MNVNYKKIHYDDLPGFKIHHTTGPNAATSTIHHLHLNANKMILYFVHGSGNIIVENKTYPIHAGDVIITDAAELFHCNIDSDTYHERLTIHIDPYFWNNLPWNTAPLFRIFTDRKKGVGNVIPAQIVTRKGINQIFTELLATAQKTSLYRDALTISKLIQLLCLLDETVEIVEPSVETALSNSLIHHVLQYLNEHFTENITTDSVASHFHITASYLSHIFKKQTGTSLWHYVILQRLHQANTLMAQKLTAEEAAYAVGFDNYANFYRLYKKYTGIAPSAYKKTL